MTRGNPSPARQYAVASRGSASHRRPVSARNPDLSPELEREVAFFLKWGYLIVEDAISLLDNPPVMDRMKAILGNCVQLHNATARVIRMRG